MVALVKADETVKFLSEYFVSHRENILKPLGSVPLAQREVIAADGQNIRATRSSKDGNDVPDNLEVNGFENTISADTPLGRFARTRKKIKGKR